MRNGSVLRAIAAPVADDAWGYRAHCGRLEDSTTVAAFGGRRTRGEARKGTHSVVEPIGASDDPAARTGAWRVSLAVALFTLGTLAASAQSVDAPLPPAATPGGAQPFLGRDTPSFAPAEPFAIPPLVERPLGLDEGPTVRVAALRIAGAEARPEHGVEIEALEAILQRHLGAQPAQGFTVNQLQAIADDVTLYYRSRGLILAQAFVPAQEVQDGVVLLEVMEGTLGGVAVEDNTLYDADVVRRPFARLLGQPIAEGAVEEALLTLQGFPGLTVFGTFRQGAELGQTELLVQVREERRTTFAPLLDNYGSEYTGKGRVGLQFGVNNPFGGADRIGGYLLKTWEPSNGLYGGVDYSRSVGKEAHGRLGLSVARNAFDVTDPSLGVDLGLRGIVEQASVTWQQRFTQRRTLRASGTLGAFYKEAETRQPGDDPTDELTGLSYTFDYFAVGRERRGMNLGHVRLTAGRNDGERTGRRGGSGATSAGSFSKVSFSYQRLQRFGEHHALLFRLDGQSSSDLLASLEQFAIGGPANVRAYPVSEALVDTGGAATLEWIIDAPGFAERRFRDTTWGDVLQVSLYADYAGGEINDPFPLQEANVNLRGYGLGLQLNLLARTALRIDVATPDSAREPSNGRDPQTYVSFTMAF